MNKKITIVSILILAITVLIIGVSYAYWGRTLTQNSNNIITSSCLKTVFNETSEAINLDRIGPMTFEDSKTLEPYSFTLVNECNIDVKYYINLETLNNTTLDDYSLYFSVNNEKSNHLYGARIMEKTLDNAKDSHMLTNGKLEINESKSFDIRLWLSNLSVFINNNNEKTWAGKVVINSLPFENVPAVLAKITSKLDSEVYQTIKHLEVTNEKPSNDIVTYALEDTQNSDFPITGYMDGDTLKMYAEYGKIAVNPNLDNFSYLPSVEELEFSQFDTSKAVYLNHSFTNMSSLKRIDLSSIDMSKVKVMYDLYYGCNNLEEIVNYENLDVSNVQTMYKIIPNYYKGKIVDLSNWNVSSLKDGNPLQTYEPIEKVIIDGWDLTNYIGTPILDDLESKEVSAIGVKINRNNEFQSSQAEIIDITNLDITSMTSLNSLFYDSNKLKKIIGIESLDTSKITSVSFMLYNVPLEELNISNWNISKIENLDIHATRIEKLILDGLDLRNTTIPLVNNNNLKYLSLKNTILSNNTFHGDPKYNLVTIDMTNCDTSNLNSLNGLFSLAYKLENIIGFETLDFKNFENVSSMFNYTNIKSLDLSGKDLSKVTNGGILNGSKIEELILDGIDFKLIDLKNFFGYSTNIKSISLKGAKLNIESQIIPPLSVESIDVTNLDISSLESLDAFFYGYSQLKNVIGLDTWDTTNIKSMNNIFYNTLSLTDISGISNWNVSNVTSFKYSFYKTGAAITSDLLDNWNINKNASFYGMLSNANIVSYPNWDGTWDSEGTFTPNV